MWREKAWGRGYEEAREGKKRLRKRSKTREARLVAKGLRGRGGTSSLFNGQKRTGSRDTARRPKQQNQKKKREIVLSRDEVQEDIDRPKTDYKR